jgi:hypothetical protein
MLLFAVLAFGISLWIGGAVYSNQLLLTEEGNALFQAHNFLDGTHSRNPKGFAELVAYESMTIVPDEDWKSRFSPGHPFWMVPGVWIGWPQVMTAISAAVTMMAMYGIGWRLRIPRFFMPVLLLASPFFLFLHGTLLPQTSGMLFATLYLMGYLKWRQERSLLWAFLTGLCWSILLQIRPLSALFITIPFWVDLLLETKRNRRDFSAWLGLGLYLLACVIGCWAFLRYNRVSTRDSLLVTYLEHEPSENWGFGPRRTQGGEVEQIEHTVQRGIIQLWRNLRSLDLWMLGTFPATLVIWFGLMVHGWSRRWSGIIFGVIVCVALGYLAFWDDGLSEVGPLHFADILPYILITGGLGLSRIWRRMYSHHLRRGLLFGFLAVGVLYFSVPFATRQALRMLEANAGIWRISGLVHSLPEPSLLFLPEDMDRDSVLFANLALNARGFKNPVLRLQARAKDRPALAAAFPERTAFVLDLDPEVALNPLKEQWLPPRRVAVNSHHSRQTGINVDSTRVATEDQHSLGFLFYGWYLFLPPGEYECRFDLRWSGVKEAQPLRLEVMTDLGQNTLGEQFLDAGLDETVIRFTLTDAREVEPRVYYGGSGTVTLREVSFSRVGSD